MLCTNCGKELTNEDTFCNNCGTPVRKDNTENITPTIPLSSEQPAPATLSAPAPAPTQPAVVVSTEVPVQASTTLEPVQTNAPVQAVVEPAVTTAPILQPAQPAPAVAEQPKVEVSGGNPAVAQVMGSDFAASMQNDDNVIPSGGINYGPAPIVDPPVMVPNNTTQQFNNLDPKPKKGMPKALFAVFAIVFLVGFLGIGIFLGSSMGNKEQNTQTRENDNKKDSDTGVSITFEGAQFVIPSDTFQYELSNNKLSIYNDDIYFYIMIAPMSYNQYSSNISQLKKYYNDQGWTVDNATEKTVGSQKYIVMDLSNADGKTTLFIRSFTTTNSLTGAIAKTAGGYATNDDFKLVEQILSTNKKLPNRSMGGETKSVTDGEILDGIINSSFEDSNAEENGDNNTVVDNQTINNEE